MEATTEQPKEVQPVLYWPARWIATVSEDTLELWKRDLEERATAAKAELDKLRGGVAQIDAEYRRRAEERKKRRAGNNGH